jgi:tetratricopeptide (TPR) repeat protein
MLCPAGLCAQTDTMTLGYKFSHCTRKCDPLALYEFLQSKNYTKEQTLEIGTYISYHGNDQCSNAMMKLCLAANDSISAENWHVYSVQNTKNGNYAESIPTLEKAILLDPKEMEGYYGWVLLYYYRDYERSLKHLEHYDLLDPGVEAPVGENIHFLKGLCHYQMGHYQKAIEEFGLNEDFEVKRFGQKNCNGYIYFYMARCYDQSGNTKQAESYYKKAIKYTLFPTEAYYYLGLLHKYKKENASMGMKCLKAAHELLLKGYKQQDVYVELFDEVYLSQLNEELTGD